MMLEELKHLFEKEIGPGDDLSDSRMDVLVCEHPRSDFNFSTLKKNTVILCPLAHGVSAPIRAKRAEYWLGDEDGKSRKVNEILQNFRDWLTKENLCEEPLDWVRQTRERVRQIISSRGYAGLFKNNQFFLNITSSRNEFEVDDDISVKIDGKRVSIAHRNWQRNAAVEPNGLDEFNAAPQTPEILESLRELELLVKNEKGIQLLFLYVWSSTEISEYQPSFLRSIIQSILSGPQLFSTVSSQFLFLDVLTPNLPAVQTVLNSTEILALSRMIPDIVIHLADAGLPAKKLDLNRITSFPMPAYLRQSLERIVPHSATVDSVGIASYAVISSAWVGRWEHSKEIDGEQIII
jgi:hypothetical protein